MSIRDVILQQGENDNSAFEGNVPVTKARTVSVDVANSPRVAARPGYIWVREHDMAGGVVQVYNAGVPELVGLPVLVQQYPKVPHLRQAVAINHSELQTYSGWTNTIISGVGPHNTTHEWKDWAPGSDVVNVYPRQVVPLRSYPVAGLNVYVDYYRYSYDGVFVEFEGETFDWSAYANPGLLQTTFILIYLDLVTNTVAATSNTVMSAVIVDSPVAFWPAVPDYAVSSCIIMHNNQTRLTESMITDVRDWYVAEDWVARDMASVPPVPDLARWLITYDTRDTPQQIELVNNAWVQIELDAAAVVLQDTESGLNTTTDLYEVQVAGDYHTYLSLDFAFVTFLTSEIVTVLVEVRVNNVDGVFRTWNLCDVLDGTLLQYDAYLPGLEVGDELTIFVLLQQGSTDYDVDYILRWYGNAIA